MARKSVAAADFKKAAQEAKKKNMESVANSALMKRVDKNTKDGMDKVDTEKQQLKENVPAKSESKQEQQPSASSGGEIAGRKSRVVTGGYSGVQVKIPRDVYVRMSLYKLDHTTTFQDMLLKAVCEFLDRNGYAENK